MSVTRDELVSWCRSKLGTPYIYGAKGEVMTQAKLNSLAASYPSTFTSSYINKAKKFIGKRCCDCSGLISWKTGIIRGSSNYKTTATECLPISQLNENHIGWALWRSGHIGVYVGNGVVIEARGIDYGTVESKVVNRNFTHVIKLKDIDYGSKTQSKEGWLKENGIWHFYQNGAMIKSQWLQSEAGFWYYFDVDGNLDTGWILGADGKTWYYCDEDDNDDLIGKMAVDRVIWSGGKNYYVDPEGKMVDEGHILTFSVAAGGELVLKSITEMTGK